MKNTGSHFEVAFFQKLTYFYSMITQDSIYVGPAGWSYKDWNGIVYPHGTRLPLQYLVQYVNTVEINSSFYRPPSYSTAKKWLDIIEVRPDFMFTYKLWNKFSHERRLGALNEEEKLVKSGLDPLRDNDKLGATLIQFPWSFKHTEENIAWMNEVLDRFADYRPFVEMRHGSWNNEEFITLLDGKKTGFVNIDQPLISNSLPLTSHCTTDTAYLRLHGRNYENWFKDNADGAARYNYLYEKTELTGILDTVTRLIHRSAKTFIIFNNHYRGQAVANALQIMFMLTQNKLPVPDLMMDLYPELKEISASARSGQMTIF